MESGDGHGGKRGDSSGSLLRSGRGREEICGTGAELGTIEDRTGPAGRAPSLPTFLGDGTENGDVNVTIFVDGHLSKLSSKGDHCSERLRERGTGQEDLPGGLEESQLIEVGKTGEEEGQTRGGRGRDELEGDKRVRRKSDDQGRFDGCQVDPEAGDLHEIVRGRHYESVVSWLEKEATSVQGR